MIDPTEFLFCFFIVIALIFYSVAMANLVLDNEILIEIMNVIVLFAVIVCLACFILVIL